LPTILSIKHESTNRFTPITLDYLKQDATLKPFYNLYPSWDNLSAFIETKKSVYKNRLLLHQVLNKQYADINKHENVTKNLNLIAEENTFTICTAHQPLLYTGTLYFIYKILHTIKLAESCKQKFKDYNFVPLLYLGTEDADIDEVGQVYFRNNQFVWQEKTGGAVGRLQTVSLQNLAAEINKLFNLNDANGIFLNELFKTAYSTNKTFADATIYIVNELLGRYGVIILNPDDAKLKAAFQEVIIDELTHQKSVNLISQNDIELSKHYKTQAHARPINLFYLKDNIRSRIEFDGKIFSVHDTVISFTKDEILVEVKNYPDRFSPNVILRGLFQETILPNIAFIGGGGELAYWLQLKPVFDNYTTPLPPIILRQSLQILNQTQAMQLASLNMSVLDLFKPIDLILKEKAIQSGSMAELEEINLQHEQLFKNLMDKAEKIAPQLKISMQGHLAKSTKIQKRIAQKFIAHVKKNNEVQNRQIIKLQDQLMLTKGLQERKDNFMDYYLQYGPAFFDLILKGTSDFGDTFNILTLSSAPQTH
jgi:bacillithiol synthase